MNDILLKEQIIAKAWEDESFKEKLLADPKSTIKSTFGVDIPDNIELETLSESSKKFYLVIPPNPEQLKVKEPLEVPRWL